MLSPGDLVLRCEPVRFTTFGRGQEAADELLIWRRERGRWRWPLPVEIVVGTAACPDGSAEEGWRDPPTTCKGLETEKIGMIGDNFAAFLEEVEFGVGRLLLLLTRLQPEDGVQATVAVVPTSPKALAFLT